MNYFIQENYKQAAEMFAKENGIQLSDHNETKLDPQSIAYLKEVSQASSDSQFLSISQKYNIDPDFKDLPEIREQSNNVRVVKGYSSIKERAEIKHLILQGSVTEAIEKINEYFPSVLDSNNILHFKLLRLNLIEMIRSHKLLNKDATSEEEKAFLSDVLSFVRNNLINKVTTSYKLLRELEITMSLLCFNFDSSIESIEQQKDLPNELRSLFDLSLRSQCYKLVNKAILRLETDRSMNFDHTFRDDYQTRNDHVRQNSGSTNQFNIGAMDKDDVNAIANAYTDDMELSDLEDLDDTKEEYDSRRKSKDSLVKEGAIEEEDNKLQELAFDSKLERLVKLWAVTVQKLIDLQVFESKDFDLNEEFF